MKIIFIFICCWLNFSEGGDSCKNILIEKAFDPKFKANYFIVLPVETSKFKEARLIILKENFRKYMIALDSSYADNNKLKEYVKDVINLKKAFFFHEFFYVEKFGLPQYKLLTERNTLNMNTRGGENSFLKKYLINYTPNEKYYDLNDSYTGVNYYFVYEHLFRLNYLVANADGFIAVVHAKCKHK